MRLSLNVALLSSLAAGSAAPSDPCRDLASLAGIPADDVRCNRHRECENIFLRRGRHDEHLDMHNEIRNIRDVIHFNQITVSDALAPLSCEEARSWVSENKRFKRNTSGDNEGDQKRRKTTDDLSPIARHDFPLIVPEQSAAALEEAVDPERPLENFMRVRRPTWPTGPMNAFREPENDTTSFVDRFGNVTHSDTPGRSL